ncbi:CUB domain-containing protein 1-like [Megalobrama amblycephala]|uniref:CUB domain-containing protein 1-like n=1 Tax=Megalobrama amblycephala TaxID=75352 RepID=UPI0020142A92|nr:CUB domain-containing protein 1-like [Megalobrama amblycephala]
MGIWKFTCFSLLLGFFQSSFSEFTGGAELNVAVEEGTVIYINTSAGINTQCEVCISQECQSSVILRNNTSLKFSCSQPEDLFTVQIIRDNGELSLDTSKSKEHHVFQKFNRTFTWILKSSVMAVYLLVRSPGLRQIQPTDSCPDKHVYTITSKNVSVGRFCQNGTITGVNVINDGKLSLEVTGGQPVDMNDFGVIHGFDEYSLAVIDVCLPEKSSILDFFTPNPFPENAAIEWNFDVPHEYYIDFHIISYTVPTCLQPEKIPKMRYNRRNKKFLLKPLDVTQPLAENGYITLSIKNCNMSRSDPPLEDLMVHFQISARERTTVQCKGNLPENQTLQIRVMKKDPKSPCVLKRNEMDLDAMDTVTIASGDYYDIESFDCNKDELELTVNQTRECKEWRNCASTTFNITFDYKDCIPGVLKMMTWHLHGPQNSSVELQSPTRLRYCLPEDECNSNLLLNVSHDNSGITVGQFCPKGTIEKIQIRESKIAVTASVTSFNDWNLETELFLAYSFTQDISEHYIFTVAPKMDNPTVLATPAWPSGMKPSSNVSWIINMEPQLKSNLKFMNVSQPKCTEVQTNIAVQTIVPQVIVYSAKKDENINDILVLESFYLNMTNCKSPTGSFRAMMEITLQSNKNTFLGIILSIVGVVIITAVVISIVLRKKKRNKTPPVSNYNPNAFLPGLHGIPKSQEEEEDPHTYCYIDESQVYSHLLKNEAENKQCKDDSGPPLPDRPVRKGESLVTKGSGMVDNELYGYTQGQSTTSGSPKSPIKTSEDEACETSLCVREESP